MSTIYISYSQRDHKYAKEAGLHLEEYRQDIINRETTDVTMGIDLASKTIDGIEKCDVFIAILSEDYLHSPWCLKECQTAFNLNKLIVPIELDGLNRKQVPPFLMTRQIIPFHAFMRCSLEKLLPNNAKLFNTHENDDRIEPSPCPCSNDHEKHPETKKHGKNRKWIVIAAVLALILALLGLFSVSSDQTPPYSHGHLNQEQIKKLQIQNDHLKTAVFVFVATTIAGAVLLLLSHRKTKHLSTDLSIISDAKLRAHVGKDCLLIEKGKACQVQMPIGTQKMDLDYSSFNNPKQINCFIAGSTELQIERDALRATISVVYNHWQTKNFHIYSRTFEDFDRKFAPDGQQPLYDYYIQNEADIAVFIIKGDVGEFTIGEFNKAYRAFCEKGKPSIVVYNNKTADIFSSSRILQKRIADAHQYWIDYETLNELKLDFQEILSSDLWTLYEKELLARDNSVES